MEDRTVISEPPGRLHALDNLRGLTMWLGIVLHVAVIHTAREALLPWRDEQRTPLADLLVAFIHAFRMPVFFILAGFFVALLLQSRGAAGMARHRARRLGLPLLLFWPPVFIVSVLLGLLFVHRMARGTWGLDPTLIQPGPTVPRGPSTMHMWFLWMLLWLSLLAAAVARWQGERAGRWLVVAGTLLQRLGAAWWGPLVLALPLVATGWAYPNGLIRPSGLFLPPMAEWLHNGLFFAFGLALFHQQWDLFALYRRRWGAHAAAGLVFFLASGALLYSLEWPALAKMAVNIAATTVVCLASYHLFVRSTWVSVLLNGKRHPKSSPGVPAYASH
jgi:glucan biosynthesis protein C